MSGRDGFPAWMALTAIVLGLLDVVLTVLFGTSKFLVLSLAVAAALIVPALFVLFSLFVASTIKSRRKKKR